MQNDLKNESPVLDGIDRRLVEMLTANARTTTADLARLVGMSEEVRNIIQGHAGTRTAGDYGETWPLVALREIEKLPRYAA